MAKKKGLTFASWLQTGIIRVCRVHFYLLGVYAIYIIASDATHLITPTVVYQRWLAAGLLVALTAIIWYFSRAVNNNPNFYRALLYALILADIAFASFNVYTQRGMASRAVLLYVIPIVVSGLLLSRVATLMTASLAAAAYVLVAVKYFVDFFNEGYKAELYIEVGFYVACFFAVASLIGVLISFKKSETELGL